MLLRGVVRDLWPGRPGSQARPPVKSWRRRRSWGGVVSRKRGARLECGGGIACARLAGRAVDVMSAAWPVLRGNGAQSSSVDPAKALSMAPALVTDKLPAVRAVAR